MSKFSINLSLKNLWPGLFREVDKPHHDGVMVAFVVPDDQNGGIAVPPMEGKAVLDLHLTLAYLGKCEEVPFTLIDLANAMTPFAACHGPIYGSIGGVGRLYTDDPEGDVIVAYFDSPDLPLFRQDLVDCLQAANIPVMANHGFIPHITLTYIAKNSNPQLPELPRTPLNFKEISLHYGDSVLQIPLLRLAPTEPEVQDEPAEPVQQSIQRATYWDALKGQYYTDADLYLNRSELETLLGGSIDYTSNKITSILHSTYDNAISPQEAEKTLREALKREYIRQYLVGIGGVENMTHSDWGSLGNMLRNQYAYLPDLVEKAKSGEWSDEQLSLWSRMNSNSASEAYNRAKAKTAKSIGYDEVAWGLTEGYDHCETCLARAELGFVKIGPKGGFPHDGQDRFPGDGSTDCRTNDKCRLTFRNSQTGEEYQL